MRKIIILQILICFSLYGFSKSKKVFLDYHNYYKENLVLNLSQFYSGVSFSSNVFVDLKHIENISKKLKITVDLFDTLFEEDIINGLKSEKKFYGKEYFRRLFDLCKKETNIFVFGRMIINKNFDSFLILSSRKDSLGMDESNSIFLINTIKNKVASISKIAYYHSYDDNEIYYYSNMLKNNTFILTKEIHSHGVDNKRIKSGAALVKYFFDNEGHIKLGNASNLALSK